MTIIYVLIPLSILMMVIAVGAFFWAVRSGQFDDLDTPALDILDEDQPSDREGPTPEKTSVHDRRQRHPDDSDKP